MGKLVEFDSWKKDRIVRKKKSKNRGKEQKSSTDLKVFFGIIMAIFISIMFYSVLKNVH